MNEEEEEEEEEEEVDIRRRMKKQTILEGNKRGTVRREGTLWCGIELLYL